MMKTVRLFAVAAATFAALGAASALAVGNRNYVAHAVGANEVPARATRAQGQAIFRLSDDGTTLYYKINVANIENVVAAHLHRGAAGVNGPILVDLFAGPAAGGRFSGTLVEAVIPVPAAVQEEVAARLEDGTLYLNIHTNDGVAPTNTGPGDFPGGEIRGQVR